MNQKDNQQLVSMQCKQQNLLKQLDNYKLYIGNLRNRYETEVREMKSKRQKDLICEQAAELQRLKKMLNAVCGENSFNFSLEDFSPSK